MNRHDAIICLRAIINRLFLISCGLVIGVLLLEGMLRAGGWIFLYLRDMRNSSSVSADGQQYRIMCIGGSTTALGGRYAYPAQLEEILNSSGTGRSFKVINTGVCRQNSRGVLLGLKENLDRWKPDMVISIVGNNDGNHIPYSDEPFSAFSQGETDLPEPESFVELFRVVKLWRLLSDGVRNKIGQIRGGDLLAVNESQSGRSSDTSEIERKLEIAEICIMQHRSKEAASIIEEVIAGYPENQYALSLYADAMVDLGEYDAALKARKRLIDIDPDNPEYYFMYALSINNYFTSAQACDFLEKAVQMDPDNVQYYVQFCIVLRNLGRREKLESVIKGAISRNIRGYGVFGYAATCSLERGNNQEAVRYYDMANKIRMEYFSPQTRLNYPRIIDMVVGRGLKMVCVQDPVVALEPLKKVLDYRTDVIYVDNEKVFKDLLFGGSRFSDLFTDNFGGEFGHASREGNRILAANIARRIIEECFAGKGEQS